MEILTGQEDTTHAVLHEFVHATTSRLINDEPENPLVKELNDLFEHAKSELDRLKIKERSGREEPYYGLRDIHEFVAEAMSNRKFQHFLANIKAVTKSSPSKANESLWTQFNGVVRRMLGLKKTEGALLDHVLNNANALMKEQARRSRELVEAQPKSEGQLSNLHAAESGDDNPILFQHEGNLVRRRTVTAAFRIGANAAEKLPGFAAFQSKMKDYYGQVLQTFYPEGFGMEAKQAAAILASNASKQMREDTQHWHSAKVRRAFWQSRPEDSQDFILNFEKGKEFNDPILNRAASAYRAWNRELFQRDAGLGIEYEPIDNYLYHVFTDGDKVMEFFNNRYGRRWGNPTFMKDRQFDFYEEAIKAGFKPKYTNPEDIMLARQHASDVAAMRVNTLDDL
ncbi:MAG: hypothetical protein ACRD22_20885, partial [Terriglobia bacterium]